MGGQDYMLRLLLGTGGLYTAPAAASDFVSGVSTLQ